MCGIAGTVDADAQRAAARVAALNEAQSHRGPDASAVARFGTCTLGNTRLAIRDLSPAGNQPFLSADGRYACVFNGEIYNHRELRHRFTLPTASQCDGAVIPDLWARFGLGALECLRGMYAVAVVDNDTGEVVLARDPLGIKPLHVASLADGTVVFASEPRSLSRLLPQRVLPPASLARFLYLGALAADDSPFVGITALAPNTSVTITDGRLGAATPILAGTVPTLGSADEVKPLGAALREAVGLYLESDVPVVLLLSSGVDSAAIAAVAAQADAAVDTITVSTGTAPGAADEATGAAATAAHYGLPHAVVPALVDAAGINEFFDAMQRPTIDGLNTHVVCRAVKAAGFKVALSGLAGDEVVGGYPHFRRLRWLRLSRAARIPSALIPTGVKRRWPKQSQLLTAAGPTDARSLLLLTRQIIDPSTVARLTGVDPLDLAAAEPVAAASPNSLDAMVRAEVEVYLQSMLLPDADAFSMCSSVELRVPFVDPIIFRSAAASGHGGKGQLADALDDDYLRALARQPKRGFTLPMMAWQRSGALRAVVDELGSATAPVWSHLDRHAAQPILDAWTSGSPRWAQVWALAALNRWLRGTAATARHQHERTDGDERTTEQ